MIAFSFVQGLSHFFGRRTEEKLHIERLEKRFHELERWVNDLQHKNDDLTKRLNEARPYR